MIIGMTQTGPTDRAKQLVHLAIATGRSLQSPQTQLIHYNYRPLDYPCMDTIPLYENFLFALALLRDRSSEGFQEGKALLERLLNFQSFQDDPSMGNFPIYLHQFPTCHDRYLGYNLLPVFYWILKHFGLILGPELRERLYAASRTLLDYCVRAQAESTAPFHLAIKLVGASEAFGRLWEDRSLQKAGSSALEILRERADDPNSPIYFTPVWMADLFIGLQMVYESMSDSPWRSIWERICQGWHLELASYVGPALKVAQVKGEPQPTLFDLYMGFFADRFSQRAFIPHAYQLQGVLIQPGPERIIQPDLPFEREGLWQRRKWLVRQHMRYGLGLLEKQKRDHAEESACSPFRLVFGDLDHAHSFACQGGSSEAIDYIANEHGVDLLFQLPAEVPPESKQRNREVQFFCDAQEGLEIDVGQNRKATAFHLGDEICIRARGFTIRLIFTLEQGNGRFFGHISPGNRPAQLNTEGPDRFSVFDRQLFIRTVSRDAACRMRLAIRWE